MLLLHSLVASSKEREAEAESEAAFQSDLIEAEELSRPRKQLLQAEAEPQASISPAFLPNQKNRLCLVE